MQKSHIQCFNFKPGKVIANKYVILEKLGGGWEGEVYKIYERGTDITRAAKFFFPDRNRKNKTAVQYAKLLHKLSTTPIVIHYHTHEFIQFRRETITCLISEYVEGEILSNFIKKHPGRRIGIYRALQLLHALAVGLGDIHRLRIYHGDLHADNIIVKRYGLGFDLKLLDMHRWGREQRVNAADDIVDSIRIFYDAIGGQKRYAKHPEEVKAICLGLKRSLISKKFKSATVLKNYLENIEWKTPYRI